MEFPHVLMLRYLLPASKHDAFCFSAGQCSETLSETGFTMMHMLHSWCVYNSCDFALAFGVTQVA